MNLNQLVAKRALKGDFDACAFQKINIQNQLAYRPFRTLLDRMVRLRPLSLKLIVLLLGMSLWSCQKERVQDTVIEGRIAELGSFDPIRVGGLRLALFKTSSNGIFPSPDIKVGEFTTDEDGRFYYTTSLDSYYGRYFIKLLDAPAGYFALDHSRALMSESWNLFQLNMNREAWLKVILNNEGGGDFDYFKFAINEIRYSHTGGGRPSVIQRVPSLDTCKIPFADYRTSPETLLLFKTIALPNDTTEFEIDLRPQ